MTALALLPAEVELEFRRCTGHCCDPVTLHHGPGYFMRWAQMCGGEDDSFIASEFVYLGWQPPSQGSRSPGGVHLYRCRHYQRSTRTCGLYGGRRPPLCRTHPHYGGSLWNVCDKPNCTRRTMVLNSRCSLRWSFPDLWREDCERWDAWESAVCRPEFGADAMPEGSDQ